jgi:dGTP triphosphohydrolase
MYMQAALDEELRLFPPALAERVEDAETEAGKGRAVVDMIAGMTETSALEIYRRATGITPGSLLAGATGPS